MRAHNAAKQSVGDGFETTSSGISQNRPVVIHWMLQGREGASARPHRTSGALFGAFSADWCLRSSGTSLAHGIDACLFCDMVVAGRGEGPATSWSALWLTTKPETRVPMILESRP